MTGVQIRLPALLQSSACAQYAAQFWQAAVAAVLPNTVIPPVLAVSEGSLRIADVRYPLTDFDSILVVGFGKAAAGMAASVEEQLLPLVVAGKRLHGLVNCPILLINGGLPELQHLTLNGARPAGENLPTEQAERGTNRILELVSLSNERELVIVLVSGGGSALSPAPVPGISLADKIELTRFLIQGSGQPVQDLNCVRRAISRIKGGGLRRLCRGLSAHALIISDVIGDSLGDIASGPLVDSRPEYERALRILGTLDPDRCFVPASIFAYLEKASHSPAASDIDERPAYNHIIANNEKAVTGAALAAAAAGYSVHMRGSDSGSAQQLAAALHRWLLQQERASESASVFIGGGEPTVEVFLPGGTGGRCQHLVLAVAALLEDTPQIDGTFCVFAAGTDGEDGPTDAAGAMLTPEVLASAREQGLRAQEYLAAGNSYEYFARTGGLIQTGLTGTNVCDVWIAVYGQNPCPESVVPTRK